jgi:serine/threonine protein phosphatase PrpC
MAYCGYIVTLKEKFPHPNADRLVLAKIFGTQCIISNDYEMLLLLTDGVTDLITDRKIVNIIKKNKGEEVLKKLIHEALYVDQHLFVPFRLKNKYLSSYTVPYKGRDNASGVIYIKKKI